MVVTNHRLHCNKSHLMASSRYLVDNVFFDASLFFFPTTRGHPLNSGKSSDRYGSATPSSAITPKLLLMTSSINPSKIYIKAKSMMLHCYIYWHIQAYTSCTHILDHMKKPLVAKSTFQELILTI